MQINIFIYSTCIEILQCHSRIITVSSVWKKFLISKNILGDVYKYKIISEKIAQI